MKIHTKPGFQRTVALAAVFLAVVACKKTERKPEPSSALTSLPLRVDGVEVGRIALGPDDEPRPLASWIKGAASSQAAWAHLELVGSDGQQFGVRHPELRYPGAEVRIYREVQGGLSCGFFRAPLPSMGAQARAALAKPIAGLRRIVAVEIHTRDAVAPAQPTDVQTFSVQVDGDEPEELSATRLKALPKYGPPGREPTGWKLLEVARERVGGRHITGVRIVATSGESALVDEAELNDASLLWLVKHNREGELRVQRFELGKTGEGGDGNDGDKAVKSRPAKVYKDIAVIDVQLLSQQ